VAEAMRIDGPMLSRWCSGERSIDAGCLLRLPPAVREEFGELFAPEIGALVIPRAVWECLSRLLHHRPRQARALYPAAEGGRRVAS
jgi:hypothetical protein